MPIFVGMGRSSLAYASSLPYDSEGGGHSYTLLCCLILRGVDPASNAHCADVGFSSVWSQRELFARVCTCFWQLVSYRSLASRPFKLPFRVLRNPKKHNNTLTKTHYY